LDISHEVEPDGLQKLLCPVSRSRIIATSIAGGITDSISPFMLPQERLSPTSFDVCIFRREYVVAILYPTTSRDPAVEGL